MKRDKKNSTTFGAGALAVFFFSMVAACVYYNRKNRQKRRDGFEKNKMRTSEENVILGAGFAGLGAAYSSGAPVYEAESYPGGISASYQISISPDGNKKSAYRFEYGGGHFIYGAPDASPIYLFLQKFAKFIRYDRNCAVLFMDTKKPYFIPYPIQNHLKNFDVLIPGFSGKVYNEIKANKSRMAFKSPPTLEVWAKVTFGETLYEKFFRPFLQAYTANLYKKVISQDRYKAPSKLKDIKRGLSESKSKKTGYNATFIYPENGLDNLALSIAGHCKVRYRKEAVKIDLDEKVVFFSDKTSVKFQKLISTIPLHRLVGISGLKVRGVPQPYGATLVLNIGAIKGKFCPKEHWLYIPKSNSGFHRIGFYSNVDRSFLPNLNDGSKRVALYVERTFYPSEKPSDKFIASYKKDVIKELQQLEYISQPEVVDHQWIKVSYTGQYKDSTWHTDCINLLKKHGVFCVGRYARWKNQGIAEVLRDGLYAGMFLNQKTAKERLSSKIHTGIEDSASILL